MSTLKLYSSTGWKLLPNKLFKVDNMPLFLASMTPLVINNFQHIKNALEVSIKVNMPQSESNPRKTPSYKYVSIANDSESICYYYVKKVSWVSQNCCRFDLVMDVLNSFTDGVDYNFRPNTRILREHKDRFVASIERHCIISMYILQQVGTISKGDRIILQDERAQIILKGVLYSQDMYEADFIYDSDYNEEQIRQDIESAMQYSEFEIVKENSPSDYIRIDIDEVGFQNVKKCVRKIDYVNENINPVLIHGEKQTLIAPLILNASWYLLYRNQNEPSESLVNPVECYLFADGEVPTDSGFIQNGRLIPSWVQDGTLYIFRIGSGESANLSNGVNVTYQSGYFTRVIVSKSQNKLVVMVAKVQDDPYILTIQEYDDIEYITFNSLPNPYNTYTSGTNITADLLRTMSFPYNFNNSGTQNKTDPLSNLDRTDAKNIKLIKLPYCPYAFNIVGGVLQVDSNNDWELATFTQANGGNMRALKLRNTNVKLNARYYATLTANPLRDLYATLEPSIYDLNNTSNIELESKLYHSDFYRPTYIYDSFSLTMELERLDLSYYVGFNNSINVVIDFDMTSTINSKFMFTFANYQCDKPVQNFYNVLTIARNNEEVLYNVPYINYIRTGYNYDIKAKNIANTSNWIGLGFSVASIGASFLAPSVPLKVAGVVASFVSMAMSVKSAVVSTIQGEETIKQKLLQAQNQTASVSGSDDVDLMSRYSENRLVYMVYKPSDNISNLLKNLFFYAGYNSGRMGIPTHNNRVNFDYLEADISIDTISANMSDEIVSELINCYKTGVTYIHTTNRTTDKWDIEQKYENWERTLLED